MPIQLCVGSRTRCDSLLEQAEEQLPAKLGRPTIEAERELIEVVLQMSLTDRSLVSSENPSLQKRHNPMYPGHQLMCLLAVSA